MTSSSVYHFHPVTGIYLGNSAADPSPLEPGVWLLPANATFTAPPAVAEGQVARFSEGQWVEETPPTIPAPVNENDPHAPQKAALAALDRYIPRGLEDYWAQIAYDTTKLPAIQQQRLAQKIALRAQIAGS